MSLGFEAACGEQGVGVSSLAVEMDPNIAAVYASNFPSAAVFAGKVEELFDGACGDAPTSSEARVASALGDVAILMGGPPCQGHSDLNNRTRRSDPRNVLYLRMARAAEILQPSVVVIENVPAVVRDVSDVVKDTIKILEKSEYAVHDDVLSLTEVGVPQTRRRHVLLATRCGADPVGVLNGLGSLRIPSRSVRWAIKDLVAVERGPLDRPAARSADNEKRMRYLFDESVYDLPNRLRPPCHRDKAHTYNAVYGRLKWDSPAPTITTGFTSMGQGRYVHPGVPRTITPHEAARLQTFPDWFDWRTERRTLLTTMIGNAVPPLLMARLASLLLPSVVDGTGTN